MRSLDKLIPLLGVILGALLGAFLTLFVQERITDLQQRPTFVAESLAFVVEFAAFYNQQSNYFRDLNRLYYLPPPQQEASLKEIHPKLSNAEKEATLLEFKATRFFHGTDWLKEFEEVHNIWSSAASIVNLYCEQQLSPEESKSPVAFGQLLSPEEAQIALDMRQKTQESIRTNFSQRLPDVSDQLSKNTDDLLNQFVSLLKSLPPENTVLQEVPKPTPTPNPNSPD